MNERHYRNQMDQVDAFTKPLDLCKNTAPHNHKNRICAIQARPEHIAQEPVTGKCSAIPGQTGGVHRGPQQPLPFNGRYRQRLRRHFRNPGFDCDHSPTRWRKHSVDEFHSGSQCGWLEE